VAFIEISFCRPMKGIDRNQETFISSVAVAACVWNIDMR
jgi:hypothetical protein